MKNGNNKGFCQWIIGLQGSDIWIRAQYPLQPDSSFISELPSSSFSTEDLAEPLLCHLRRMVIVVLKAESLFYAIYYIFSDFNPSFILIPDYAEVFFMPRLQFVLFQTTL